MTALIKGIKMNFYRVNLYLEIRLLPPGICEYINNIF